MCPSDEPPLCKLLILFFSIPSRVSFHERATVDSVKLIELSFRVPGERRPGQVNDLLTQNAHPARHPGRRHAKLKADDETYELHH
jgi:hypothetical protein